MVRLKTLKSSIGVEERAKIAELRALVKDDLSDYYDTDFNLLRWLQGIDGPIENVAYRLRKHLQMRNSVWKLDELHMKPRDLPIHKYVPDGFTGLSKVLKNTVIQVEQSGRIDYDGFLRTYSILDLARLVSIPDFERMLANVMKVESETGEQGSAMFIMDLSELKYSMCHYSFATGHLRNVAEFIDQHYVQLVKYIVAVNVPFFAYAIWKAMRPLLPTNIQQRVRILSPSNWRKEILEYADPSALPSLWNGKGENLFTAFIDRPLRLPREGYFKMKIPNGAEKVFLPAGETTFICRKAKQGQIMNFWVLSDGTFASGIYFTEDEEELDLEKMDPVYPCFAWVSGPFHVPLMQSFVAEKTGTYKFWYTNERAWFHTLTLTVLLTVSDEPLYLTK
ncbi:unnamed protein product [Toxocara canis]|uniref:CRAL-TRIO domain-containing protein n=1 Tax=Toxocara canis TaxID=6265 RepID=A0A183TYM6_TOXCA|nr:unnamed protein product [Toxocara canis]